MPTHENKSFLLTAHGKFLSPKNKDYFFISKLFCDLDKSDVFDVEINDIQEKFIINSNDLINIGVVKGLSDLGEAFYSIQNRSLSFKKNNHFITALPVEEDVLKLEENRTECGSWECFLPLNEKEIEIIKFIMNNNWVLKSKKEKIKKEDIKLKENFIIDLGPISIDLRYQSFIYDQDGKFFDIYVNNWEHDRIILYNPIIYYTSYKSEDVMKQLYASIFSLKKFGDYKGKILVLSDKKLEEIKSNLYDRGVSRSDLEDICIYNLYPVDFVGYVATKFFINKVPNIEQYQPILYLDPDIVIDRNIESMLIDILASQSICAPIENFSPISKSPSVGGTLSHLAGIYTGYMHGFNGGTIGFYNTKKSENFINVVKNNILNCGSQYGRRFNRWVDQEVINYVSAVTGDVRTDVISKYVRYGYQTGSEYDFHNRCGLVHFFGRTIEEKQIVMNIYISGIEKYK